MKHHNLPFRSLIFLIGFATSLCWPSHAISAPAPMDNYCITPPYIGSAIAPNLLLMIDNSASMYDLQYQDTTNLYCANDPTMSCTAGSTCSGNASCILSSTSETLTTHNPKPCTSNAQCTAPGSKCVSGSCSKCNTTTGVGDCVTATLVTEKPVTCTTDATCSAIKPGDTCNNRCTVTPQCFDSTYSPTVTYSGYFTPLAIYNYDFINKKFISEATMPGTCTYGGSSSVTPHVCVNTSGTPETIDTNSAGFVARGSFLNWLTASKFDIEKQILNGGKYDAVNQVLIAENRGCAGRKFIKEPSGVLLTFAIRGGTPGGISQTTSMASEYGQTFIEVYTGNYNASACMKAMNDWVNVTGPTPPNLGTFQNDSKDCVGAGSGTLNATNMWNHVLHNCYKGFTGGGGGWTQNLNALEGECAGFYATIPPDEMNDANVGYAICSSELNYIDPSGNPQLGYLGTCWNGTNFVTGAPCPFSPLTDAKQMENFCRVNVNPQPVVDPSSTAIAGSNQGAPGFIMEQGLINLAPVGTLQVKIALATPPTGLIDKFKNRIRFGVMSFQNNGSGTECVDSYGDAVPCYKVCSVTNTRVCLKTTDCPAGESCGTLAPTDGAKMVSYIGAGFCQLATGTACMRDTDCPAGDSCKETVGDHSAGLIKSIDDIPATSWTPFAEAFYNATGYFARTSAYTDLNTTSRSEFNFTGFPASYALDKSPSQSNCQQNNILLITDGMSTADQNPQVDSSTTGFAKFYSAQIPSPYTNEYGTGAGCPSNKGSKSLSVLSWVARNRNIKTLSTSSASIDSPTRSSEYIKTYVVSSGPTTTGSLPGLCDPYTLLNQTAVNGGTNGVLSATNPAQLSTAIENAFDKVAAVAASGTAASVLASGEGSGANLIQAVFYPRRTFINSATTPTSYDEITWTGRLSNFWYYVDPYFATSSIREDDGGLATPDKILNLKTDATHHDYIVQLYYDKIAGVTRARRWEDPVGNGVVGSLLSPDISFENLSSLWEAGTMLWKRDVTTAGGKRKIYTSTTGTSFLSGNFSMDTVNSYDGTTNADNRTTLARYLQSAPTATGYTEAANIIKWVQGVDVTGYRPRTVKIESIDTTPRVWKLGDVVNSTPKIQSWTALNNYHKLYQDSTYGPATFDPKLGDPVDNTHFITTSAYKNRGMIYTGGNDGMLHAFKLGQLQLDWTTTDAFGNIVPKGATEKARLVNPDASVPLGQEMWAFIPKNALPYLRYMADPNYCHVYSVDLTPVVFDAAIGDSISGDISTTARSVSAWRTVLIVGMRFGGSCKKTCGSTDCVNTPTTDPLDNTKGLGYSSYFALDVTDPINPTLLWEFSNENLGFATTGPVMVRTNGTSGGSGTNGKWFVIFGSGPTGPINPDGRQFLGRSDQSLKLFILDLKTGSLLRTMGDAEINIQNAFAGSLNNGALDVDMNYQDDLVYIPYVKKTGSDWTDGGVGRLVIDQNPDPATWSWSKLIDGIGPAVTAPSKLVDKPNNNLWVYFGTGRYYFAQTTAPDDETGRRHLIGLKDPCFDSSGYDSSCTDPVLFSNLRDATNVADAFTTDEGNDSSVATGSKGCYITLDPQGSWTYAPDAATSFSAERVITDVLASSQGVVFFTSFKPYTDQCTLGGKSFIWALKYNTCGKPEGLKGKILIQVSTGSIEQKDLPSAFADKGERRTAAMEGKPPEAQGLSLISAPPPTKKVIHIKER